MRQAALTIASIAVVLVVRLGTREGILWMVDADERFAGIERDAATTPPPYEAPADEGTPTRVELLGMLRDRDFEGLTDVIDAKQAAVVGDIRNETELHRVVETFSVSDPTITPLIEDWIAATPDSAAPYLASATHVYTLASDSRGGKLAFETTSEQFAGMDHYLEKLTLDATAALEREPRSTQAYRMLVNSAGMRGRQGRCGEFARAGLAVAPASLRIRWSLAMCRLPRWGGSRRAVEAIFEKARPFLADNPELAVLAGVMAWDEGRLLDGAEAMTLLDEAVASGDYPVYLLERAREHNRDKRPEAALEDATLGLDLSPEDPDLLAAQFLAYFALGRVEEAQATFALLEEVDPTREILPGWRDDLEKLASWDAARRAAATPLAKALRTDVALTRARDWDAVIRHWSTYLRANPDEGRAYLERAGAHRQKGDMDAARADILQACSLGEPRACLVARDEGWR